MKYKFFFFKDWNSSLKIIEVKKVIIIELITPAEKKSILYEDNVSFTTWLFQFDQTIAFNTNTQQSFHSRWYLPNGLEMSSIEINVFYRRTFKLCDFAASHVP